LRSEVEGGEQGALQGVGAELVVQTRGVVRTEDDVVDFEGTDAKQAVAELAAEAGQELGPVGNAADGLGAMSRDESFEALQDGTRRTAQNVGVWLVGQREGGPQDQAAGIVHRDDTEPIGPGLEPENSLLEYILGTSGESFPSRTGVPEGG
jgi:hypothetical protein